MANLLLAMWFFTSSLISSASIGTSQPNSSILSKCISITFIKCDVGYTSLLLIRYQVGGTQPKQVPVRRSKSGSLSKTDSPRTFACMARDHKKACGTQKQQSA
eukprot:2288251-Pyramimonas_sp.AAC.1